MTRNSIFQHFRPEERYFVERVLDLINRVEQTYVLAVTEFLDPRQVYIVKSLVGQFDLQVLVSSDYVASEYAKVIIAPTYYQLEEADFQMALVEISYNSKFNHLSHSQIMGSILNQLGLKRHLIGDIRVRSGQAQVFVDRSILSYLITHLTKMGRVAVSLAEVALTDYILEEGIKEKACILVSSLRLDKLLAEILRIPRSKALKLIEAQKVKVNYKLVDKASELLEIGDMVSVRGFGRFNLLSHDGKTKQDKHKLTIQKMLKNK